jgi:hypothetical protein
LDEFLLGNVIEICLKKGIEDWEISVWLCGGLDVGFWRGILMGL